VADSAGSDLDKNEVIMNFRQGKVCGLQGIGCDIPLSMEADGLHKNSLTEKV